MKDCSSQSGLWKLRGTLVILYMIRGIIFIPVLAGIVIRRFCGRRPAMVTQDKKNAVGP